MIQTGEFKVSNVFPLVLGICLVLGAWCLVTPASAADPALEPFDVKDCTGPAAGKTLCYYCRYELRPVVCVFTREIDDGLGELVAAIDGAVAQHRAERLAAFVVFLGRDTDAAEAAMRRLVAERKIRHTPLTIYRDTPDKLRQGLGVSTEAPLTIRFWREGQIVAEQRHASTRLEPSVAARLIEFAEKLADGTQAENRP